MSNIERSTQEPLILTFEALGIDVSDPRVGELTSWVEATAKPLSLTHDHSTSRDIRGSSVIRKTTGILNTKNSAPLGASSFTQELYVRTCLKAGEYLGRVVTGWGTGYDAVGHLYLPGDSETEGHVDQMPSATVYLKVPREGGLLYIARNPQARSITEIRDDAFEIQPIPNSVIIFDGQELPHFVSGIPASSEDIRVSVNFSMDDGTPENGVIDWGYFKQ